jgi:hypothetical protein
MQGSSTTLWAAVGMFCQYISDQSQEGMQDNQLSWYVC